MTPSQLEHLRLIDAHLDKLLDIAAKRTPGEWHGEHGNDLVYRKDWIVAGAFDGEYVTTDCPIISDDERHANATFIASCAGNAEAGWRATKAAIKSLLALTHVPQVDASDEYLTCCEHYAKDANDALESILAAWPIEMLTK